MAGYAAFCELLERAKAFVLLACPGFDVEFKGLDTGGICFEITSGELPNRVCARWLVPYDESTWEHSLKTLCHVVRWHHEKYDRVLT